MSGLIKFICLAKKKKYLKKNYKYNKSGIESIKTDLVEELSLENSSIV